MKRVVLLVLDSVGIGALPDAHLYNDEGANTLANIANALGGLNLPTLQKMGLGNIHPIKGVAPVEKPIASYGKMAEKSPGKDTTTGHWEIAGYILDKPFPTYPNGFPQDLIEEFEKRIGRKTLGNYPASGTQIIEDLGEEHVKTGYPIVYTSADSVFQIAAHEEVIPLEELYEMCRIAREMLVGDHGVGRVIARPFIGQPGNFSRTTNRKDFSRLPDRKIVLQSLQEEGYEVLSIGKIWDIYGGVGITKSLKSKSNLDGLQKTIESLKEDFSGLIMTNLVDFDMLYGHRNDVEGYGKALMETDQMVGKILDNLKEEDILIITADHGCDPTHPGTDHTREYVPILVYGKKLPVQPLGVRESFVDVAATLVKIFNLKDQYSGKSLI
ncbi:phosphopentomutase [Anaerobranca californiensis DSM 14826]|uniref:Phosphopentomutase n=1 Tax=Anaerobranca californiensis DSM 14826 TaxID=1120989 RepID=A0A1M6L3Q3_9FIRM|nr:phosphopentomutase [Anaerobranca californiensis]SHJ65803.1 phosphopentomutase [Anaerobranca californiensis DSM 14826]